MTSRHAGVTVVELLIASAILGLLAAVAVPQLAQDAPTPETRAELVEQLGRLRSAVDAYWAQHDGFPGQAGADQLARQLCGTTDPGGTPRVRGLGPYLPALPANPLSGSRAVRVVDVMPAAPLGDEGWIYARSSGQVRCNSPGAAPDGPAWFQF